RRAGQRHADLGVGVGDGEIRMTLTSPACPEAQTLPRLVRAAAETVDAIESANVELVWEPAWSKDMMCDEAQLELGLL
ncbi:MAG: hypothetical protein AAGK78_08495, partial [Planctomycetota bacterium]